MKTDSLKPGDLIWWRRAMNTQVQWVRIVSKENDGTFNLEWEANSGERLNRNYEPDTIEKWLRNPFVKVVPKCVVDWNNKLNENLKG